jgi:hypothetical protein
MPGTKNSNEIARNLLIGVAVLLVVGIAGSVYMGARARNTAIKTTVDQATEIADNSLGLVFRPEDLAAPVPSSRATDLTTKINSVVTDPSSFDSVTLWSQDGQILYSTNGRIGNSLDGERDTIREALRGKAQTSTDGGEFSVMIPLQLHSGVGEPTAVEMTTAATPITSASGPWNTNGVFLAMVLAIVAFLLFRMTRPAASAHPGAATRQMAPQPAPVAAPAATRPITVPSPGLREESEARRQAEDRARAAEERLGVLQDQYRKTLDDLRAAERRVQEQAVASRPDPRAQEELAATEQRARDYELKARELESKLRTLEEEHRELAKLAPDPELVARANDKLEAMKADLTSVKRERDALTAERDELSAQRAELAAQLEAGVAPAEDPALLRRIQQAETEVIGLRAELDGSQTQLTMAARELETLRPQAERAKELQEDLDAAHVDSLHSREAFESAQSEARAAQTELEDARIELRALRNEEQRAAMLEDELRASKAEIESLAASHRAELVEREAEFEEKVRGAREEFQGQVASLEAAQAAAIAAKDADLTDRTAALEAAAKADLEALQKEIADRDARYGNAEEAIEAAKAEAARLAAELAESKVELEATAEKLTAEAGSARDLADQVQRAERELAETGARASRLAADLDDATQGNADLNRRLQEVEARRALELADLEGRADLDELLRVTQERLAGQTEKLIAAEDRVHRLERDLKERVDRIDVIESELRQAQMAQAMRNIRGEGEDADLTGDDVVVGPGTPIEDRRATTPFMKELSSDARRSVSQILGLTQILKHKKDSKEQAQLMRQLGTYARRLDHLVSDLAEADTLVHGEIELTVRRTDLEALVSRVVEESGVDADHDVRVLADRVVVAVDPLRTEQILTGLLRASADRTPPKKGITVRLAAHQGGALLSVEDPEPSSDASLGPVVQRFAEAQGGWGKVESLENGGSAFRVFLPDGAKPQPAEAGRDEGDAAPQESVDTEQPAAVANEPSDQLHIMVGADEGADEPWSQSPEQMLVQELHRLSEITAED